MGGQRPYRGRYGEKEPIGDIEAMGAQRPYRGILSLCGDNDPIGNIMGGQRPYREHYGGTTAL